MAQIMRMPALLADATEAILVKWLVKEGAPFKVGQAVAEVETEKALVEIPAEVDGVLGKILVVEGKQTEVGQPIAILLLAGESASELEKLSADLNLTADFSVDTSEPTEQARKNSRETNQNPEQMLVIPSDRIFISPIARKLAREEGVDISRVRGSGPGGRIVKADIYSAKQKFISTDGNQSLLIEQTVEVVPHSRMRKAIARRLTESKQNIPHFYLSASLIADEFLNLRKQINEWATKKISVTDLILKTVAATYFDVPKANCIWSEENIQYFQNVDIAVAVASENGLITPVVRNVDSLRLEALATKTGDLFTRARDGKLKQDEILGGTISVTNLGMYDTEQFYAIINPPQSMILAVGAAKKKPVVKNDQLAIATVINFTLSVDHRSIDGAIAAEWLNSFAKRFENPMWMILGEK